MASEVSICNVALSRINAAPITSLTDGSRQATLCHDLFPALRDELLRVHTWNFAVARVLLARREVAPVFGWSYAYQLPADFIRVVSVHGEESGRSVASYRVEGDALLSDDPALYLRYIKRVTDTNIMTPDFRRALSLWLAADLALGLGNSRTLRGALLDEYRAALQAARSADAIEDTPLEEPDPSWVTARA